MFRQRSRFLQNRDHRSKRQVSAARTLRPFRPRPNKPLDSDSSGLFTLQVLLYCLMSSQSRLAVDVFLSKEEAEEALAEALTDEPDWSGVITIEEIWSPYVRVGAGDV